MSMVYDVPHNKLHMKLVDLRAYLVSIGYPLGSNEEINAPDSVIRLRDGYHLVNIEYHSDHNIYTVEQISYTKDNNNE